MKISIDNQVVRLLAADPEKALATPLTSHGRSLSFSWPSLLEYLGLGRLLSRLSPFDQTHPLYNAAVSALCEVNNPEDLFYIYDSLFAEMLKQVKSLSEIDASFLLQKIEEKKAFPFAEIEKIVSPALAAQEKALRENAPRAMHDLILYLAWDRMCLCMARLFDDPCQEPRFLQNLRQLNWCLVESFHHIAGQGKTSPSFYRLIEALFYYQMRKEHLQIHSEAEWELLSQSFSVLKDPNELIDFFYIDSALAAESAPATVSACHLTLDPPAAVECRLALARYILSRIKEIFPKWNYSLISSDIIHLSI